MIAMDVPPWARSGRARVDQVLWVPGSGEEVPALVRQPELLQNPVLCTTSVVDCQRLPEVQLDALEPDVRAHTGDAAPEAKCLTSCKPVSGTPPAAKVPQPARLPLEASTATKQALTRRQTS